MQTPHAFADWQPEPELRAAPPRRVFKSRKRLRNGCVSCLMAGMALLGVIVFFTALNSSLALFFGSIVAGRVESYGPDKQGIELRYSYRANGQRYKGAARVGQDEFFRLPVGAPLRVRVFRPTAGFGSFLEGIDKPWGASVMLWAMSFFMLVIYGGFFVIGSATRRSERWLVRYGVAAPALLQQPQLVAVARGNQGVHLPFEFAVGDARDARIVQAHEVLSLAEAGDLGPEPTATALYDPRDPSRCRLYRFLEFRA